MSTIKPTEKSVILRRNRISELKATRTRIDTLSKCRETEFWKSLKPLLEESIKKQEYVIENGLAGDVENVELTYSAMARAYGVKLQAQATIDLVEHPQDQLDRVDSTIKRLEDEIKDAMESGVLETAEV